MAAQCITPRTVWRFIATAYLGPLRIRPLFRCRPKNHDVGVSPTETVGHFLTFAVTTPPLPYLDCHFARLPLAQALPLPFPPRKESRQTFDSLALVGLA